MPKNTVLIVTFVLATVLIFSSIYIGNSITSLKSQAVKDEASVKSTVLMSAEEAAQYLGLDFDDFMKVVKEETVQRQNINVYSLDRFIAFVEIGGKRYFNREQLDKWVQYHLYNK